MARIYDLQAYLNDHPFCKSRLAKFRSYSNKRLDKGSTERIYDVR